MSLQSVSSGVVVTTVAQAVAQVELALVAKAQLVAIDGVPGAGKTRLAISLSTCLGVAEHFDLDDFLVPDQGKYFAALRIQNLSTAISGKLPKILSGACMRQVLDALGISDVFHIYVKRIDRYGDWPDEFETVAGALERLALESGLTDEDWALQREVRDYHLLHAPHQRADLLYERYENAD